LNYVGFFENPTRIRQRLRQSPFNLCPACLVTEFLPGVKQQHPGYSREEALLEAIGIMEAELRR
jgi:hypothetical protein